MDVMREVIMGRTTSVDEPHHTPPSIFEGKVRAVSGGKITFTVPAWDRGKYVFGPVPYAVWSDASALADDLAHTHTMVGPKVGDTCLVVFVGGNSDIDAQSPWVLGWRTS